MKKFLMIYADEDGEEEAKVISAKDMAEAQEYANGYIDPDEGESLWLLVPLADADGQSLLLTGEVLEIDDLEVVRG